MKFYFFNSYHQSLMGFQLTRIATGDQALQLADSNRCDTPELQSAPSTAVQYAWQAEVPTVRTTSCSERSR